MCSTDNFLDFLCISKVSSMLHLGSMKRVCSSPQINIKLYCEEKLAKQTKKLATGEIVFTVAWQFSTFPNSFKLVPRAFCGGSITFLVIILLPN